MNNVYTYLGCFDTEEEAKLKYATEKENYIKRLADIWKDKIEERVYLAMYNYKVKL